LKFAKSDEFHGIARNCAYFISWKTASFTKNVTAVQSWIKLVPTDSVSYYIRYIK